MSSSKAGPAKKMVRTVTLDPLAGDAIVCERGDVHVLLVSDALTPDRRRRIAAQFIRPRRPVG